MTFLESNLTSSLTFFQLWPIKRSKYKIMIKIFRVKWPQDGIDLRRSKYEIESDYWMILNIIFISLSRSYSNLTIIRPSFPKCRLHYSYLTFLSTKSLIFFIVLQTSILSFRYLYTELQNIAYSLSIQWFSKNIYSFAQSFQSL